MWTTYGAGFITTIGAKEDNKTYFITETKKGAFVVFRVVTRRYAGGENKYESMDCKRFITGDPKSFCNMLQEKTMVSVSGTLEQYYNKETKITRYCINCTNVDFCGKLPTAEKSEPKTEEKKDETKSENHFE